MRIKRYIVNSMPEAMEIIKRDLGQDAVIISSRKVRKGGFFGFFQDPKLEVTAAIENTTQDKKPERLEVSEQSSQNPEVEFLKQEFAEVKNFLKNLQADKGNSENQQTAAEEYDFSSWRKNLGDLDFSEEIIDYLLKDIRDYEEIPAILQNRLTALFEQLNIGKMGMGATSKVVTFVGPPGVGKTTTLAKLAANFALFENKKIALITIDTYRIGAVEQLKIYGDIMNIPVDIIFTPQELKEAVKKHEDKDLIFLDTAGRPSNNKGQLMEMKSFLDVVDSIETYLVVSCGTKNKDLLKIVKDYKLLNYNKLIFTKLDETATLGSIVNIIKDINLPLAYISMGQNVPDDIEVCEPHKLAKKILEAVI